jgi:3-hydroxybutyrate dehydrogenase
VIATQAKDSQRFGGDAPLRGKHALVTGGGRGIGAAIAGELGGLGASLTLVGRQLAPLRSTAERLSAANGRRVHVLAVDVTDPAAVERGFADAVEGHGAIVVLVNNAGAAESAPFARTDRALWARMMDANLTSAYLCTQALLPGMQSAGWGRIVNVASTAALKGYPYVTAYCAAKHGLLGLTRALAIELVRGGITVNAVCPGYTDTDLVAGAVERISQVSGRSKEEALSSLTRVNPMGRLIQPDEVAASVAWLCLPQSAAITGHAIAIAGGEVM